MQEEFRDLDSIIFSFGANQRVGLKEQKVTSLDCSINTESLFKHEIEDICFSNERFYLSGTLSKTKRSSRECLIIYTNLTEHFFDAFCL